MIKVENFIRCYDTLSVDLEESRCNRHGAGGEYDEVGCNIFGCTVFLSNGYGVCILHAADALDYFYACLVAKEFDSFDKGAHDLILASKNKRVINGRLTTGIYAEVL